MGERNLLVMKLEEKIIGIYREYFLCHILPNTCKYESCQTFSAEYDGVIFIFLSAMDFKIFSEK